MAQKVAQKESQAVTMAQSTAVVKNCVRLAVSTVAFARNLFPKDAFVSKTYGGVTLEVLRPVDQKGEVIHDGALRVHDWLEKGAFKALDEDYLEKVTFNILDAHPSDPQARLIESYSFRVNPAPDNDTKLSVAAIKKQNVKGSSIITTSKTGMITKDQVHAAMQQLVRTLVMVTSSLDPLPTTRWLSMSITYNDSAPPEYEAPEFCPQDPSLQPKFAGGENEPLIIPVGEVNTGFHNVSLRFRQSVMGPADSTNADLPCTQQVEPSDGYDSDDTTVQWKKKKEEIVAMAERIARNAQVKGESVEAAIRSSEVGKVLPEDVLSNILQDIKLTVPTSSAIIIDDARQTKKAAAPAQKESTKASKGKDAKVATEPTSMNPPPVPTIVTQKRTSRVKRPLQQITDSNSETKKAKGGHDKEAMEVAKTDTINSKTRPGTYSRRT